MIFNGVPIFHKSDCNFTVRCVRLTKQSIANQYSTCMWTLNTKYRRSLLILAFSSTFVKNILHNIILNKIHHQMMYSMLMKRKRFFHRWLLRLKTWRSCGNVSFDSSQYTIMFLWYNLNNAVQCTHFLSIH